MSELIETYRTTPAENTPGTFFFTDCGGRLFSLDGENKYHGCLCPKCFSEGKITILYKRGSEEANRYWNCKFASKN